MAYSYTLHFDGSSGKKAQDTGYEFDAVYRVITDDAQDQSQKVIDWFESNVLAIGDGYEYGNDEYAGTVAKSIVPKKEKGSTDIWVLTVHYAPPGAGEFSFEFVTEDLPLRCEDVTMTTIQHQKPVEKAIYRGGFVGAAATKMPVGTSTIPVNSAMVPFDPGLEKDVAGLAVRAVFRLATVDGTAVKTLMNSVNDTPFTMAHCGFILAVDEYQARIVSGALALRSEDGQKYWELPIAMEIIEEGWRDFVVDRGTMPRACEGDPSGRGAGSPINANDKYIGIPDVRVATDIDETPITEVLLMDGDGGFLSTCTSVTPVYIEYQKYLKEIDFRAVPLFAGFIS